MTRWITQGITSLALAALAGCDYYSVVPGMTQGVTGEAMPPAFQIGDTVQFYAREFHACSCDDPGDAAPPSAEAPEQYKWAASTDRTFYLGHGRFVMTKIGDVAFFLSTKRSSTYSFVSYIGPRVSGVKFSLREMAMSPGDSAIADFDATDAAGAPIAEYRSIFYSMYPAVPPDQSTAFAFRKSNGRVVVFGKSPGETIVVGKLAIWNADKFRDTIRVTVR